MELFIGLSLEGFSYDEGNMGGSSQDYESFHAMLDLDLNPFDLLRFQDEVP